MYFDVTQGVYSASFYGASYASFVPVTVKRYFDFRFSFITAFPNGLLLHSGNASRVSIYYDSGCSIMCIIIIIISGALV